MLNAYCANGYSGQEEATLCIVKCLKEIGIPDDKQSVYNNNVKD